MNFSDSVVNCEECQNLHGDDAPCEECKYKPLMPANIEAWHHWGVLNTFDRPPASGFGGIPTINSKTVRDYCRDFDFSELTYKKILAIEKEFKDCMLENQKKKEQKDKNAEDFQNKMKMPIPIKNRKR
jgi:hypothetical protein